MFDDINVTPNPISCREVITCEPDTFETNIVPLFSSGSLEKLDKAKLDSPFLDIVNLHEETLLKLSRSTYRVFLESVFSAQSVRYVNGSGQVIPVAPGLWLSCNHVINSPNVVDRYCSNDMNTAYNLVSTKLAKKMGKLLSIDKNYLDAIAVNDKDPITGKKNDVADFDLALVETSDIDADIIYPDSGSIGLTTGDVVAAFHHPGVADYNVIQGAISQVYGNITGRPSFLNLSTIFLWSQKSISFGKILPQTPSYSDNNIAVNSCNLIAGSSSAFIHRIGALPNTFTGVHVGGDFVHCTDCLSISPINRKCEQHNEAFTSCDYCRASGCSKCVAAKGVNLKDQFGYNYFYKVNHPAFVALYARYVIPRFQKVPDQVISYLKVNKSVLQQHKDWIGSHITPYL